MTEVGPVSHGETEAPFPRPATQRLLYSTLESPHLGLQDSTGPTMGNISEQLWVKVRLRRHQPQEDVKPPSVETQTNHKGPQAPEEAWSKALVSP